MPDASHAATRAALQRLLHALSPIWPAAALDHLREDLAHDEFGEALENLIALALRDGLPLPPAQLQEIEALADRMGMADLPTLARLRRRRATRWRP